MDTYEAFVWEPALVKTNAITAATEAACLARLLCKMSYRNSNARLNATHAWVILVEAGCCCSIACTLKPLCRILQACLHSLLTLPWG